MASSMMGRYSLDAITIVVNGIGRSSEKNMSRMHIKSETENQTDKLISLCKECELFLNQYGEPFVKFEEKGHWDVRKISSKYFRSWLSLQYSRIFGKAPSTNALKQALNMLEAEATFSEKKEEVHLRVAWHDGVLYYDLADKEHRVVKISEDGWKIVNSCPVLFTRYSNTAPQVEPKSNHDSVKMSNFINITNDDQGRLLFVTLVALFIPDIPRPVLDFYGEKGSAKSTTMRLLRKIVDPAQQELMTLPNRQDEMAIMFSHNYMPAFDNLDKLKAWQSDMICKAVTGTGFSKRRLYTDEEEVIWNYYRCITLNGINLVTYKPDLMDRSILIELDRIPKDTRRVEKEYWEEFENARPTILAGIFDVLSKALSIYPKVKLPEHERMADYCKWGCAISEVLRFDRNEYLAAYEPPRVYRRLGCLSPSAFS
ncbi:MAG: hypothetical protein SWK76_17280 [Actinomycetota bacterium]|nr:hypothetical protein [Actinomycetota bacterium]